MLDPSRRKTAFLSKTGNTTKQIWRVDIWTAIDKSQISVLEQSLFIYFGKGFSY